MHVNDHERGENVILSSSLLFQALGYIFASLVSF